MTEKRLVREPWWLRALHVIFRGAFIVAWLIVIIGSLTSGTNPGRFGELVGETAAISFIWVVFGFFFIRATVFVVYGRNVVIEKS